MSKVIDLMKEAEKRRHTTPHANDVYLYMLTQEFAPALQVETEIQPPIVTDFENETLEKENV